MKVRAALEGITHASLFSPVLRIAGSLTAILLFGASASAATSIRLDSPTGFFTNIAARLLRSELNLDLNHLQIYPTNQYTPSVHRLLQITANLYDSTTNRTFGLTPEYPYCPSVFRPLFRRLVIGTNTYIFIAGYREVSNADLASDSRLAPMMIDLGQPNLLARFPQYGTVFSTLDKNEPMVSGIPLVIGAKKGFPNFNEFSMQTQVLVTRLLEFRRAPGDSFGPVIQTNQMYTLAISNNFGLEAWNSYLTNYPRDLKLITSVSMTAIMTNETGSSSVLFSNNVNLGASFLIPSNSWNGWTSPSSAGHSIVLPFGSTNSFLFLTNSTYINSPPWFLPQTHLFSAGSDFYVPHWWLNLNTRVIFILVDTQANRIVDYVNLNRSEPTLDLTAKLMEGSNLNPGDYQNPANQWLTNRFGDSGAKDAPTYGILNQVHVGISGTTDWRSFAQDPFAGLDAQTAVDGFRYNLLGLPPIYPQDSGRLFYKSNVFYAPFDPYRPIFIHTTWQANDPLVHYMSQDLADLGLPETNRVDFSSRIPALSNLGQINNRYSPWGGNPYDIDPTTDYQLAIKDPGVFRSDEWDFPHNQRLGIDWIGRVHRGTPWQTMFLKSTNILQYTTNPDLNRVIWSRWTGNPILRPDWQAQGPDVFDALSTAPIRDWHLVGLLNDLFNTNALTTLASPNQNSTNAWEQLLNGMTVLTNVSFGQVVPLVMTSNSPQAEFIAQGLLQNRSAQPGQIYRDLGDILSTPELTVASPWLGPVTGPLTTLTDAALEIIPSQLLSLLRSDSLATPTPTGAAPTIQFSGIDGISYAVQASPDLLNWVSVSTNTPNNGFFYFAPRPQDSVQFFRSKLLP